MDTLVTTAAHQKRYDAMNPSPRHHLSRRSCGTTRSTRTNFMSTVCRLRPEDIKCDTRTPAHSYAPKQALNADHYWIPSFQISTEAPRRHMSPARASRHSDRALHSWLPHDRGIYISATNALVAPWERVGCWKEWGLWEG